MIDKFANPPKFKKHLYSENNNLFPIGTKGAPCPPSLTSCSLKLTTTFWLINLDNSGKFPIWTVIPFLGLWKTVWPWEHTASISLIPLFYELQMF